MNKRTVGKNYEEQAKLFLESLGMTVLERNFRIRTGEIDLIARDGEYLVFVEVKYRASRRLGDALEAVDARKQQRIFRTAQYYLKEHGLGFDTPCRFDVVGINGSEMTHIKNAFWG
ncbi:MAG: YraN family protein [Eubacteriales bacterium]|nr:YraN family protein [Eubacteriales bacterium]